MRIIEQWNRLSKSTVTSKHRLKDNFAQIWKTNINLVKFNNTTNRNENNLRTYSKFKTIFKQGE
jgi:hypothetical protein